MFKEGLALSYGFVVGSLKLHLQGVLDLLRWVKEADTYGEGEGGRSEKKDGNLAGAPSGNGTPILGVSCPSPNNGLGVSLKNTPPRKPDSDRYYSIALDSRQ